MDSGSTAAPNPIAVALATGMAMVSVALLVLVMGGGAARADRVAFVPSTGKVVALHEAMDRLWTDHVTWTRLVIVEFDANAPDLKPDLARLLRNQVEIGNAIKPYYGAAAGNQLTSLLHT